jgi:hypothetical protein
MGHILRKGQARIKRSDRDLLVLGHESLVELILLCHLLPRFTNVGLLVPIRQQELIGASVAKGQPEPVLSNVLLCSECVVSCANRAVFVHVEALEGSSRVIGSRRWLGR